MDNLFAALKNIQISSPDVSDIQNLNVGVSKNDLMALEILGNLNSNDTIMGIVSKIQGNSATILINNEVSVTANLNADITLTEGNPVLFEVGKDKGNSVTLRPLFTNVSNLNLADAAIKEAELPMNEKSYAMLSSMIDKGLSIDKDSVTNLYRTVQNNPEIPVNEIVSLKATGLPVNNENIMKFDAVVNFEAKISDSISSIIDEIPREMENLFENDYDSFNKLTDSLLSENNVSNEDGLKDGDSNKVLLSDNSLFEKNIGVSDEKSTLVEDKLSEILKQSADDGKEVIASRLPDEKPTEFIKEVFTGKFEGIKTLDEVLKLSEKILKDDTLPKEIKDLVIKSDLFKNSLKDKLSKEWLLEPSEFKNSKSVEERMDKMIKFCTQLTENLSNDFKGSETLTNSINNFKENLNFLENLNNLTPYIQIPMRLGNEANTGDLYVYAKKKNLLENSDNLSALLRLDMKNLGPIEVYVKLSKSKNLSTDFMFESEESLLFVEKNINLLNERLEKIGYNVKNSFNTGKSVTKIFDNDGIKKEGDVINLYKFDVRA